MKKLILICLALAFACSEEDEPKNINHLVGSWYLYEPEVPMEISFEVPEENAGTFSAKSKVVHPLIPESEEWNNNMFFHDRFENHDGYGKIEIISRGTTHYIITMIYSKLNESGIAVYDIQVDIAGQDYFILQDRIFTRQER